MLNGYWQRSNGSSTGGVRWLGWDKMSFPKGAGGLGFRDLHGFNLALPREACLEFLQQAFIFSCKTI